MDMNEASNTLGPMPHCDPRVLHAPGECKYCDGKPEGQALRVMWDISFTGHAPTENQSLMCPSDARRGVGGAHVWYGNQPKGH